MSLTLVPQCKAKEFLSGIVIPKPHDAVSRQEKPAKHPFIQSQENPTNPITLKG